MAESETGAAQSRYEQLQTDRTQFVTRAHRCAELTIPTLFRKDGQQNTNQKIKDPAQSLGARGVATLASKMVLSLLPVSTPFFKMNVDKLALAAEVEDPEQRDEILGEVRKGLGEIERGMLREVENSGDVVAVNEMLKHLIVTGNVLVYVGENGMRLYDLNKYVVIRSPEGRVLEVVVCEHTAPAALEDRAKALITDASGPDKASIEKSVPVYTHVRFKDDRVMWHQEIEGQKVPGSEGDVPAEGSPWLALRFIRVDGESYGRSYVEQFLGDLESLEVLTTSITDAAVAASKVIWLVRPNGTTTPKVLAQAPNNAVRSGNADDVSCLRMDKATDMRFAQELLNRVEGRVAYAFMVNSEVLRDAERVTAEEVRFVAQELDDSLGGIYSVMSTEFQLPYVKRRLHLMRKQGKIPKLPDMVKPVIVTGFAALGRSHDMDRLKRFVGSVIELVGPEQVGQFINIGEAIERIGNYEGIDTNGLLVDADKREASAQQGQNQQLIQQLLPEIIKQLGPVLGQQMQAQGTPGNGATAPNPQAAQQAPAAA